MTIKNIRNFSIIAHIDHGKSTLADRMLELTNTVEKRKMREQVLDSMELERERGITIKMQPVRMVYRPANSQQPTTNDQQQTPSTKTKLGMERAINSRTSKNTNELPVVGGEVSNSEYILNLIDTPGHIDFFYEVSRALKAVEGAILLVDSTQGVQAQTLTTLSMAKELGITIIPVLSKIDSPLSRIPEVREEVVTLLNCADSDVLLCSGKTGEGVKELMEELIKRISPPELEYKEENDLRALIFDFNYSSHKGVSVYVRVFDGTIKKGDKLVFAAAGKSFTVLEVGTFAPDTVSKESLSAGEIGYVITGIKQAGTASVGDTLLKSGNSLPPLAGYMNPSPVVWASVYPESQDDFSELKQSLERLKLSDSSLSFEEESSGVLGRGFRCGFLGMLHLEIVTERLKREFNLNLTVTTPSITYEIEDERGNRKNVYSPVHFPDDGSVKKVYEPWVELNIITPATYVGSIMQLLFDHEAVAGDSETFGDGRIKLVVEMPLRELMRNFFGRIKTASSGYASLSYKIMQVREADVVRLDVLVADEMIPAFSRVISRRRAQEEAEQTVERLYKILPRQLFVTKIQAKSMGRILSAKKLSALKKDVTGHLYGGDITRKRKLWEKQKKGKKKLKERGKINIPHDVFLKMIRAD